MYTSEKELRKEIWEQVEEGLDLHHEELMQLFETRMAAEGLEEAAEMIRISLENYYWLIRNCLRTEILEEDTDDELSEPIEGNSKH